jgi:ketosteroid isomerase-like protein
MSDEGGTTVVTGSELEAHHAIRQLMLRYCRGVDRLDADLIASAFHDDALIEVGHAGIDVAGAEWPATAIERNASRSEASMHTVLNQLVEVDGEVARSETYFHRHQVQRRGAGHVLSSHFGRYLDRCERRGGEWRIAHRSVVSDWTTEVAVRLSEPGAGGPVGSRDRSDPSYALFGAPGPTSNDHLVGSDPER